MKNIQIENGVIYLGTFPEKPTQHSGEYDSFELHTYYVAVDIAKEKALREGLFEDQRKAKWLLWNDDDIITPGPKRNFETFIPDEGFYYVNLPEWEKVEQQERHGKWYDVDENDPVMGFPKYRTVIRFK